MPSQYAQAPLSAFPLSVRRTKRLDLFITHFKVLSLHVVFILIPMLHNHDREIHGQMLQKLTEITEAGLLKPV